MNVASRNCLPEAAGDMHGVVSPVPGGGSGVQCFREDRDNANRVNNSALRRSQLRENASPEPNVYRHFSSHAKNCCAGIGLLIRKPWATSQPAVARCPHTS